MSVVSVTYRFADGDCLNVEVEASNAYPDALDQAAATALRLYREALGVSIDTLAAGEDDD